MPARPITTRTPPTDTDTEMWLAVAGWEGLFYVSDQGNVWSARMARCLQPNVTYRKNGEVSGSTVTFRDNGRVEYPAVGRLVLEAFEGHPEDGQVALHDDDNPINNVLSNLSWGWRGPKHGVRTETYLAQRRRSNLTPEDVRELLVRLGQIQRARGVEA